jgi:MerR family mercuric resistance operon transcriptional regulator
MSDFTIAGLAREGGVGVETVRYYQRRGLLETPARPRGDGYGGGVRRYGEEDVRRLRFIRSAQAAGFTLEQIGELLALDATDDRARARELARERIAALDAKIAELSEARNALARLARECRAGTVGPCPIIQAFEPP